MKEKKVNDDVFDALERELPMLVPRAWKRWAEFIPLSARTIANADCKGTGPEGRLTVGSRTVYPRAELVKWLRERTVRAGK